MDQSYAQTIGSRRWRRLHSTWLIWPVIGLGMMTGFAFAYIGLRAHKTQWLICGVAYFLVASVVLFSVGTEPDDGPFTIADGSLVGLWLVGMVHAEGLAVAVETTSARARPGRRCAGWRG